MTGKEHLIVCDLGRVEYGAAWNLQRLVQGRLIEAKRSDPPSAVPHVMLLVEHPPVFTLGKSGDPSNLLASEALLKQRGAAFFHIDRGGDITFHGPGQIVGYPILDLNRFFTDIHRYLRELEETVIRTCGDYGIIGRRIKGRTGVWVGEERLERKLCAMGIRCSRWVTMHGFALNVSTDLEYFNYIVPCGISDRTVTSLSRELNTEVDLEDVRTLLVRHFAEGFSVTVERLYQSDAEAFLGEFTGEPLFHTIRQAGSIHTDVA